MYISIVIPTFNRQTLLSETLHSISQNLTGARDFEVLIIDNHSTDQTKKVSEIFIENNKSLNARYIFEPIPGLLAGRHRGEKEAKGEILAYIDDDVFISKSWLGGIKDAFRDSSVHLASGPSFPYFEKSPPHWLEYFWVRENDYNACPYLSLIWQGEKIKECTPHSIWGLNYCIRKDCLRMAGGFHPDCTPGHLQYFQGDGETGLSTKVFELGFKCIYHPKILLHHIVTEERLTKEYFKKRFYYEGIVNSYSYIRKNDGLPKEHTTSVPHRRNGNTLDRFCQKVMHPRSSIRWFLQQKRFIRKPDCNSALTEEEKIKSEFHQAYLYGYNFHKEMVNSSPDLLKWVLKEDYFDYQLPNLKGFSN